MPLFDLPLAELQTYAPDVDEPEDFDAFWQRTLDEARAHDLALRVEPAEAHLRHVEVYDVTFAGFGGHPVKAWYSRPAGVTEDLPVVVSYIGYSGGRGMPWETTLLPSAGYATLRMDSRGQGWSVNLPGHTPDPVGHPPAVPGVMTRGLDDPEGYYYRRLFTDAARAVEAARELPGTAADAVVVSGASQGGGIAIAAAGLVPDVAGLMPDVPFLQHMRRAVEIVPTSPYSEITAYLATHRDAAERTWRTLSYFDGVSFASRGRAPSLWSVALMDMTCPPSTVYASYNRYGGPRDIEVYTYNGHEGGGPFQTGRQLAWLRERFG
ncbi:MAG TPA: acetylxylan esterase [Actinotalea caeni]|uniref:acetylxylan esterase n=1 Tax=Actinotalea caeni TaxID=1348467 RepID=UPI002B4B20AA|nr:acetylxylan esterase [Actinotalea caeni]HLV55184.1 acetylxylan esterase [Actinotalea caeni]